MFQFKAFKNNTASKLKCSILSIQRLIIALLLFMTHQVYAQSSQSDQLQFRQLTIDDGLPSMYIYDIAQDVETYLWIGTEAGLSRFDGYNFKNFTTRNGLPNNEVVYLQTTTDGRVWINTIGNLVYLKGDSIYQPNYLEDDYIIGYGIVENANQEILLSSHKKLYKEIENQELELVFNSDTESNGFALSELEKREEVWIYDLSYLYCFKNNTIVEKIKVPYYTKTINYYSLCTFEHYVVINTIYGLVIYDIEKQKFTVLDSELSLFSKMYFIDNYLWGVSPDYGLIRYKLNEERTGVLDKYESFTKLQPTDFLKDREGNFWVSTMGNGLYFSPLGIDNAEVYTSDKELFNAKLSSLLLEKDKVWLGTRVNSLIEIENGKLSVHNLRQIAGRSFNRIRNIQKLSDDYLLLTTDVGLLKWKEGETIRIESSPMKDTYVHNNKKVLISTPSGVFETTLSNLDSIEDSNKSLQRFIDRGFEKVFPSRSYQVMYDSKEDIWLSNIRHGLIQIKRSSESPIPDTIYWKDRSSIFNTLVSEMRELDDGTICLATNGQGLIFIQDDNFYQLTTDDGISSDICNAMVTDGQQIWIATNQGLTHLDKVIIKNGKVITNVSVFDKSNGLVSNELEALEEDEGKLYLVSPSGLMIVEEENLRQGELPPQLILKSVKVNGIEQKLRKKYEENSPYILAYDQNNLQIEFIGISYKSFGNIRYKYRLEGFDDKWMIKKNSDIKYQNLKPGKYKFVVYSLGRNGKKSDIPQEIYFIIEPYFWYTAMPVTMIILFGVGLTLAGFRYFTFRRDRKVLSRMVKEKTSQLNEKMEDLEKTNTKLKESNEELERFAHVVSHDLKTPLRSIGSFVQVLDRKLGKRLDPNEQKYLHFVSSGVKKMEMVIKDLLSMSKLRKDSLEREWIDLKGLLSELEEEMLVVATNDHAKLEVAQSPPNIYFNKTNAKQLYQNLIGNGFKYNKSEIPIVQVGWEQDKGIWIFYVKDNGIGIEKKYQQKIFDMFSRLHNDQEYDGTGIGLAICKKIVEESGGQIWIDSEINKGSTFYFTLGENVKASH